MLLWVLKRPWPLSGPFKAKSCSLRRWKLSDGPATPFIPLFHFIIPSSLLRHGTPTMVSPLTRALSASSVLVLPTWYMLLGGADSFTFLTSPVCSQYCARLRKAKLADCKHTLCPCNTVWKKCRKSNKLGVQILSYQETGVNDTWMLYSHPARGTDKELLDSKSYIKLVENSELRGQVKIYYYSLQATKEVFCVCVLTKVG